MPSAPDISRHVDGASSVVLVDRFEPILLVVWTGSPTEELLDHAKRWFEQRIRDATERGAPLVMIADASQGGLPSPAVRRKLTEPIATADCLLDWIAITPQSNLLRGVLHAVSWIIGPEHERTIVGTYREALERADAALLVVESSLPDELPREDPWRWVQRQGLGE
jgi:hypothetical protein